MILALQYRQVKKDSALFNREGEEDSALFSREGEEGIHEGEEGRKPETSQVPSFLECAGVVVWKCAGLN